MALAERRTETQQLRRAVDLGRVENLLYSRAAMGVASAAVAGVFWEAFGRSGLAFGFPPLSLVAVAWVDLVTSGVLIRELPKTLQSFAIGYALAVVVGLLLGALMGRYAAVDRLCSPYINGLMAAPKVAFIPLFILWFGATSVWARIANVFIYTFYIVAINTATGVRNADFTTIEMARSFGARELQLFTKVLLPSAIPMILAGLRLGTARAIKGMITGEMLITVVGLGGLIMTYGASFMTDYLFAMIFTIFLMAFFANVGVQKLEERLIGWRSERVAVDRAGGRGGSRGVPTTNLTDGD